MDWKDQLDKKAQELNILPAKEAENGSRKRNSNRTNSGSSNSVRNQVSSKKRQDIKSRKKGGEKMITIDAALSDVDLLIKEAGEDKAIIVGLKAVKVLLKFLSTMRSNQLLTDEDKKGIKEARAKRDKERETKKEPEKKL